MPKSKIRINLKNMDTLLSCLTKRELRIFFMSFFSHDESERLAEIYSQGVSGDENI